MPVFVVEGWTVRESLLFKIKDEKEIVSVSTEDLPLFKESLLS